MILNDTGNVITWRYTGRFVDKCIHLKKYSYTII